MSENLPLEVDIATIAGLRDRGDPYCLLDVREPREIEVCAVADSLNIPMGQIPTQIENIPKDGILVVMCHHGGRSLQVTAWLREQGFSGASSLAGGIDAWAQAFDPQMPRY